MKLKYLFLLLYFLIPLTLFGEEVCPRPSGCPITEEGVCVGCIQINVVETLVVSNSECPNYFELHHGGKTCEIQRNICGSSNRLCNQDFRGCKRVESSYNKRFERNHGKRTCG